MHPDLSSHLHTEECNKIIDQLKACHDDNKFKKFLGVCSDLDRQVYKCLMKEREANRKTSAEAGMKRRIKKKEEAADKQ